MEISPTILQLLIKLCNINKKLRWQIRCTYVEASGEAILYIIFYENVSSVQKGTIAFNETSWEVINFRYSGYSLEYSAPHSQQNPDNLVDLLLDLINYEKSIVNFKL